MNEMRTFQSNDFGEVRVLNEEGEPIFCLTDVCKVLGLSRRDVKDRLTDEVVTIHPIMDNLGREQNAMFVNEDGLYDVILDSRKPEAKKFRKWITSEVVPSIRKHGTYMTDSFIEQTLTNPDYLIQLATHIKEQRQMIAEQTALIAKQTEELEAQEEVIAESQPKLAYYEKAMSADGLYTTTQIAKEFGKSGKEFNKVLHQLGVQYNVNGQWILYAKYANMGLTATKTYLYETDGGTQRRLSTMWTETGRKFLYELMTERMAS